MCIRDSEYPGSSFADGGGEGDERFQAAALGFGAEPVEQERDVGLVQVGVEHGTERLLSVNRPWRTRHATAAVIPQWASWWRDSRAGERGGDPMNLKVIRTDDGARLSGEGAEEDVEAVNRFLTHLGARAFSPATVRAYAFDLLNFLRFCAASWPLICAITSTGRPVRSRATTSGLSGWDSSEAQRQRR